MTAAGTANTQTESAHRLLELLRDPHRVITRVEETCEVTDNVYVRRLCLNFAKADTEREILLDLLRPKKGALTDVIVESNGCVRLSHSEHVDVCKALIFYRFVRVYESIVLTNVPDQAFVEKMAACLVALCKIPEASTDEARQIFEANLIPLFGNTDAPRVLQPLDGVDYSIDSLRMYGLQMLCQMLCDRYLVLVRVPIPASSVEPLKYRYSHDVSELSATTKEGSARPRPWRRLQAAYRTVFGVPPTWLRIHVPMAKRTSHYTLQVDAPDDYFFSEKYILESSNLDYAPNAASLKQVPDDRVKWAYSLGRRPTSQFFIGSGHHAQKRLYLGLVVKELPARSTFRVFALTILASVIFVGFSILTMLGAANSIDTASLTAALLALVSLWIQSSMPRTGLLGAPVLARSATGITSILSLVFCFWLLSRDLKLSSSARYAKPLRWLGGLWLHWMGPLVAVVMVGLTLWVGWRSISIARAYMKTTAIAHDKHNLYKNTTDEV